MNNDLISRSELKKAIMDNGCRHSHYFDIFDVIDNVPTVDINTELSVAYLKGRRQGQSEGRPQGEWKETGYETGALGITYRQTQCSNCGWECALPMWWNFCPNCGADMRKWKNDETTDN